MIAYNNSWLDNLFARQIAAEAFSLNCLNEEELVNINNKYPVHFYTPNFFIRTGLFVLTTVVLFFTFGIFALLFLDSIEHAIGGMLIFFALLAYALLEYVVQVKKHFQSGVDDALLWIFACALYGGIAYLSAAGGLANSVFVFVISLYSCLRFGDKVMSVVCYISFLGIFFFACINIGTVKAFIPFVIMAVSITTYLLVKKTSRLQLNLLYSRCIEVIYASVLISFYLSGNYYVVRELNNFMFNIAPAQSGGVQLAWFFWLFTILVPCFYIAEAIRKKNIVLLRVGLLLVAAIIFTIKYYYPVAPIEILMTVGGILLVISCYGLTWYLKTPKYGFTNMATDADSNQKLAMESIIVAETFTSDQAPAAGNRFGGGTFGGGGASGDF